MFVFLNIKIYNFIIPQNIRVVLTDYASRFKNITVCSHNVATLASDFSSEDNRPSSAPLFKPYVMPPNTYLFFECSFTSVIR